MLVDYLCADCSREFEAEEWDVSRQYAVCPGCGSDNTDELATADDEALYENQKAWEARHDELAGSY